MSGILYGLIAHPQSIVVICLVILVIVAIATAIGGMVHTGVGVIFLPFLAVLSCFIMVVWYR